MPFLKTSTIFCLNILGKLGRLSSKVDNQETISRYIFAKDYIKNNNDGSIQVKADAFMPARDNKTSVYRVTSLDEKKIWFIGFWFCELYRNYYKKPGVPLDSLQGRTDFIAENSPFENGVYEYQPSPHFRHIDIGGWGADKSQKKLQASAIALRAQGFFIPDIKYKPSLFFSDN